MYTFLQEKVSFSSYWLPVILFIAAQSVVIATVLITNRVRQVERNKEFEMRLKHLESNMIYDKRKLDQILDKVTKIEIDLNNKQNKLPS